MILCGIMMGGERMGEIVQHDRNTLILPPAGDCYVYGASQPVFVAGERQQFHYLSGAGGMGFWWPVRFGHPVPAFTSVLSVLQTAFIGHVSGKITHVNTI